MKSIVKNNSGAALVLDGHSAAAVESLQSLGRAGVAVDVGSEVGDCLAFVSRYCRRSMSQPAASDAGAFLAWLEGVQAGGSYALVVPSTENSLAALNTLPDDHPLRRLALMPSARSMSIALSKQATWELAVRVGVPVPASRLIQSEDTPPPERYPTVLKPVRSLVESGGKTRRIAAIVAHTPREREIYIRRYIADTPIQEQEYASGVGVGVECLYAHGRMVWCFMHERIHELPLTGGGSTYRRSLAPMAEAIAAAKRLLDALEWHGVAMVEFKRDAHGRVCLMEINPRLWGSLALAIDAGVDFPLGMWKLARGERLDPQPRYRVPYFTRKLDGDLEWMKNNLRADHKDPLLLTRPRLRSVLEMFRPLLLIESWDHFDIRDWRVIYRLIARAWLDNFKSLREFAAKRLRRTSMRAHHERLVKRVRGGKLRVERVLFLCYGNICRSAFCEVYARRNLPQVVATSAGFHNVENRPSPSHVVRIAEQMQIDMSGWQSRQVNRAMIDSADLILVMDDENYRMLIERFPAARGRVVALGLLGSPQQFPIEDPYALDETQTQRVLEELRNAVDGLAKLLGRGGERGD